MTVQTSSRWKAFLGNPGPTEHCPACRNGEFFGEAVNHFAAEDLTKGESIIIVLPGLRVVDMAFIARRLPSVDFNVKGTD